MGHHGISQEGRTQVTQASMTFKLHFLMKVGFGVEKWGVTASTQAPCLLKVNFPQDQLPIGPSPLLKTSRDEFCFLSLLLTTSISQICLHKRLVSNQDIVLAPKFHWKTSPSLSSSDVRTRNREDVNKKKGNKYGRICCF